MTDKSALANKIRLIIKKSGLPAAGKGLFTKTAIPKNTLLIEYKGKITTWKKIQDGKKFNGYVFYINRNHVVDAKNDKKILGRYANDAKGLVRVKDVRNNAGYVTKNKKVFIKALRDIAAGEEILVSYGKEYWDVIRYNIRLEKMKEKNKLSSKKM